MNTKLASILGPSAHLYPAHLEAEHPRLIEEIANRCDSLGDIEVYLNDLMLDTRGGERTGFSNEILLELFHLSNFLNSRKPPQPISINNWPDEIDLEQVGKPVIQPAAQES